VKCRNPDGSPETGLSVETRFFLAFSPDGKVLSTAGSGTLSFWDAYTSRLVAKMTLTETNRITGLAFTPDGLEVAATRVVGTVEVCSVQGKEQTM
jgi:WD40 repeat protein